MYHSELAGGAFHDKSTKKWRNNTPNTQILLKFRRNGCFGRRNDFDFLKIFIPNGLRVIASGNVMIASKGIISVVQYLHLASIELHKIINDYNRNESENRLVSFLFEKSQKVYFLFFR